MEIDVTHMVEDADSMIELSGSCMEHGPAASRITWNNSKQYASERPLLTTDDQRDAARAHFKEYGAWTDVEIAFWTEEELQAIICTLYTNRRSTIKEGNHMTREFEHYQGCHYRDPDNCSACALTDTRQDAPNYAAWPLAYMENCRTIPAKWRNAFKAEMIRGDNPAYAAHVRATVKRLGVRFSDGKGLEA